MAKTTLHNATRLLILLGNNQLPPSVNVFESNFTNHHKHVFGSIQPFPRWRPRSVCQGSSSCKIRSISNNLTNVLTSLQETVGSVTGSEEWKSSGQSDKQAGIDAMKQASSDRDPNQSGFGKVEEQAGKLVGCEGMEKEGEQSKQS